MWPELGYSSLLWKLGNIGSIDTLFRPATISWLLMLWSLWNSIVAVWCRDTYVAKQTHRGGIRAGHPPLWDHLHLGVSSWRMKSRCLTFTLTSRLVNKHIHDLHNTESYITFQPGSFCLGQCRPWTPIWRQIWNPIYRRTTSTEVIVKISISSCGFMQKRLRASSQTFPHPQRNHAKISLFLIFLQKKIQ